MSSRTSTTETESTETTSAETTSAEPTETGTEPPAGVGAGRLVRYGLLAAAAAIAVNAVVRVVALAVTDVPAEFFPLPLGWAPVVASTAVGAVAATAVYGVVSRYASRPNRTFTVVAAAALVLSFGNLLTPALTGAPGVVYAILGLMHVTAAVPIVAVLRRASVTESTGPVAGGA